MNDLAPIGAPAAVGRGAAAAEPAIAPGFEALLDRLGRGLAPARKPEDVQTPDDLREAVQEAEASFTTAMDLRRQLEEAFRLHLQ
jgi:hypothetical protein